jgi:hypothetical protein
MPEEYLIFMFEGKPVGYFRESKYPVAGGIYRYMPFRGPDHSEMQNSLSSSGKAHCYYKVDATIVEFTVVDCPRYGVLELEEFKLLEKSEES